MVRPALRSLGTIQEVTVTSGGRFEPDNIEHFSLLIDAGIGPLGGQGADLFQFVACSPSAMEAEVVSGGAHWLRHYLLLERWSYAAVEAAVTKLCTSIDEPTWEAVALKLARYMHWEFEDYQE